jgi:hypothetical protein
MSPATRKELEGIEDLGTLFFIRHKSKRSQKMKAGDATVAKLVKYERNFLFWPWALKEVGISKSACEISDGCITGIDFDID